MKKQMSRSDDSIMVICAHSDDQIFGPGGTIAKYAKEGKKVFTVIFSFGEMSHPIHKKQLTAAARVKEAKDVDHYIGGSGVVFLGLDETKFAEQWKQKKMYPKLKKLIMEHRPSRIFTHSMDDPQPDHRALHKIIIDTCEKMKCSSEIYMFDIWNLLNFKKQTYPKVYIDITQTFDIKIKALKMFESQKVALFSLMWSVYIKAWLNGKKINAKYAEVFYRLR